MGATSAHFSENELSCHCGCGENRATQRLVDFLEWLRARFEDRYGIGYIRVVIVDATRCDKHNAGTPNAAKNSQHPAGEAADLYVEVKKDLGKGKVEWNRVSAREIEQVARRSELLGGIGPRDSNASAHCDVRDKTTLGRVAQWCYAPSGKSVPYYVTA